jgi:hypothetical protein
MNVTPGSYRHFLAACYGVGFVLIVAPLLDAFPRVWPFDADTVGWRFGAVGIGFNLLVMPVLGASIVMAVGLALDHRRAVRVESVFMLLLAAGLLASLALFTLDYLQLRRSVNPELLGSFDSAAWRAMAFAALMSPVCAWLGRGGLAATRITSMVEPLKAKREVGLVVGQQQ